MEILSNDIVFVTLKMLIPELWRICFYRGHCLYLWSNCSFQLTILLYFLNAKTSKELMHMPDSFKP